MAGRGRPRGRPDGASSRPDRHAGRRYTRPNSLFAARPAAEWAGQAGPAWLHAADGGPGRQAGLLRPPTEEATTAESRGAARAPRGQAMFNKAPPPLEPSRPGRLEADPQQRSGKRTTPLRLDRSRSTQRASSGLYEARHGPPTVAAPPERQKRSQAPTHSQTAGCAGDSQPPHAAVSGAARVPHTRPCAVPWAPSPTGCTAGRFLNATAPRPRGALARGRTSWCWQGVMTKSRCRKRPWRAAAEGRSPLGGSDSAVRGCPRAAVRVSPWW